MHYIKLTSLTLVVAALAACTSHVPTNSQVPVTNISPTMQSTTNTGQVVRDHQVPVVELQVNDYGVNRVADAKQLPSTTNTSTPATNANNSGLLTFDVLKANNNPYPIFTKVFGYKVVGTAVSRNLAQNFSNNHGIYDGELTSNIFASALIKRMNATEAYKADRLIQIGKATIRNNFRTNNYVFDNTNQQQLVALTTLADVKTDRVRILQFSAPNVFIAKNAHRSHFITAIVLTYPTALRQSLYTTLVQAIYKMQTNEYNVKSCKTIRTGTELCNVRANDYTFNLLQTPTKFTVQMVLPAKK